MDPHEEAALRAEWRRLLEEVEALFKIACELDAEQLNESKKTKAKSEALREFWAATSRALEMYATNPTRHQIDLTPFPGVLLLRLAKVAEELGNGNVATLVTEAASGGRPRTVGERHHIAYGIAYLDAVERGQIVDRSPNKTVRKAYNVTKKRFSGGSSNATRYAAVSPCWICRPMSSLLK